MVPQIGACVSAVTLFDVSEDVRRWAVLSQQFFLFSYNLRGRRDEGGLPLAQPSLTQTPAANRALGVLEATVAGISSRGVE